MKLLEVLHILILLFFLSIPFLPFNILKKIYFLPIILPLIWVFFGACPISVAHGNDPEKMSFTRRIYNNINKNITQRQTSDINTLILVSIMVLIVIRFKERC